MAEQLANNAASILTAAIPDAVATTLTVANGTVFPATGNFRIIIDTELLLCTSRSGNTLTVTRGIEGTTAASHLNGAAVTHVLTQAGLLQYLTEQAPYISGELGYAQITTNVNLTVVAEASAVTIVTAPAITVDGATAILIEFFTMQMQAAAGASNLINLWEGANNLGYIGQLSNPATAALVTSMRLMRRFTPTAGSHTYTIKGYALAGAGLIGAGAGGAAGVISPSFVRITRA
jgi:hypothetical protein